MAQAQAIRASMDAAAVVLTDAQAAAAPLLYRPWDGEGAAVWGMCLQVPTGPHIAVRLEPGGRAQPVGTGADPRPRRHPRVAAARQHQPLHDRRQGDTRRQNMAQHL